MPHPSFPIYRRRLFNAVSKMIEAEKVLVQKSGYFARAAPANSADVELIRQSAVLAVHSACERVGGVIGMDENAGGKLRVCEFPRIKGGKPFDSQQPWFKKMLREMGQDPAEAYPVEQTMNTV